MRRNIFNILLSIITFLTVFQFLQYYALIPAILVFALLYQPSPKYRLYKVSPNDLQNFVKTAATKYVIIVEFTRKERAVYIYTCEKPRGEITKFVRKHPYTYVYSDTLAAYLEQEHTLYIVVSSATAQVLIGIPQHSHFATPVSTNLSKILRQNTPLPLTTVAQFLKRYGISMPARTVQ